MRIRYNFRKETRDFILKNFVSNKIKYPVFGNDLKIINFQTYESLIRKTHSHINICFFQKKNHKTEFFQFSFSVPLNNVQIISINPFHILWKHLFIVSYFSLSLITDFINLYWTYYCAYESVCIAIYFYILVCFSSILVFVVEIN